MSDSLVCKENIGVESILEALLDQQAPKMIIDRGISGVKLAGAVSRDIKLRRIEDGRILMIADMDNQDFSWLIKKLVEKLNKKNDVELNKMIRPYILPHTENPEYAKRVIARDNYFASHPEDDKKIRIKARQVFPELFEHVMTDTDFLESCTDSSTLFSLGLRFGDEHDVGGRKINERNSIANAIKKVLRYPGRRHNRNTIYEHEFEIVLKAILRAYNNSIPDGVATIAKNSQGDYFEKVNPETVNSVEFQGLRYVAWLLRNFERLKVQVPHETVVDGKAVVNWVEEDIDQGELDCLRSRLLKQYYATVKDAALKIYESERTGKKELQEMEISGRIIPNAADRVKRQRYVKLKRGVEEHSRNMPVWAIVDKEQDILHGDLHFVNAKTNKRLSEAEYNNTPVDERKTVKGFHRTEIELLCNHRMDFKSEEEAEDYIDDHGLISGANLASYSPVSAMINQFSVGRNGMFDAGLYNMHGLFKTADDCSKYIAAEQVLVRPVGEVYGVARAGPNGVLKFFGDKYTKEFYSVQSALRFIKGRKWELCEYDEAKGKPTPILKHEVIPEAKGDETDITTEGPDKGLSKPTSKKQGSVQSKEDAEEELVKLRGRSISPEEQEAELKRYGKLLNPYERLHMFKNQAMQKVESVPENQKGSYAENDACVIKIFNIYGLYKNVTRQYDGFETREAAQAAVALRNAKSPGRYAAVRVKERALSGSTKMMPDYMIVSKQGVTYQKGEAITMASDVNVINYPVITNTPEESVKLANEYDQQGGDPVRATDCPNRVTKLNEAKQDYFTEVYSLYALSIDGETTEDEYETYEAAERVKFAYSKNQQTGPVKIAGIQKNVSDMTGKNITIETIKKPKFTIKSIKAAKTYGAIRTFTTLKSARLFAWGNEEATPITKTAGNKLTCMAHPEVEVDPDPNNPKPTCPKCNKPLQPNLVDANNAAVVPNQLEYYFYISHVDVSNEIARSGLVFDTENEAIEYIKKNFKDAEQNEYNIEQIDIEGHPKIGKYRILHARRKITDVTNKVGEVIRFNTKDEAQKFVDKIPKTPGRTYSIVEVDHSAMQKIEYETPYYKQLGMRDKDIRVCPAEDFKNWAGLDVGTGFVVYAIFPVFSKKGSAIRFRSWQEADDFIKKNLRSEILEKIFSCPAHPGVKSKKEGKCPECGKELEQSEEGYKETDKYEAVQVSNERVGTGCRYSNDFIYCLGIIGRHIDGDLVKQSIIVDNEDEAKQLVETLSNVSSENFTGKGNESCGVLYEYGPWPDVRSRSKVTVSYFGVKKKNVEQQWEVRPRSYDTLREAREAISKYGNTSVLSRRSLEVVYVPNDRTLSELFVADFKTQRPMRNPKDEIPEGQGRSWSEDDIRKAIAPIIGIVTSKIIAMRPSLLKAIDRQDMLQEASQIVLEVYHNGVEDDETFMEVVFRRLWSELNYMDRRKGSPERNTDLRLYFTVWDTDDRSTFRVFTNTYTITDLGEMYSTAAYTQARCYYRRLTEGDLGIAWNAKHPCQKCKGEKYDDRGQLCSRCGGECHEFRIVAFDYGYGHVFGEGNTISGGGEGDDSTTLFDLSNINAEVRDMRWEFYRQSKEDPTRVYQVVDMYMNATKGFLPLEQYVLDHAMGFMRGYEMRSRPEKPNYNEPAFGSFKPAKITFDQDEEQTPAPTETGAAPSTTPTSRSPKPGYTPGYGLASNRLTRESLKLAQARTLIGGVLTKIKILSNYQDSSVSDVTVGDINVSNSVLNDIKGFCVNLDGLLNDLRKQIPEFAEKQKELRALDLDSFVIIGSHGDAPDFYDGETILATLSDANTVATIIKVDDAGYRQIASGKNAQYSQEVKDKIADVDRDYAEKLKKAQGSNKLKGYIGTVKEKELKSYLSTLKNQRDQKVKSITQSVSQEVYVPIYLYESFGTSFTYLTNLINSIYEIYKVYDEKLTRPENLEKVSTVSRGKDTRDENIRVIWKNNKFNLQGSESTIPVPDDIKALGYESGKTITLGHCDRTSYDDKAYISEVNDLLSKSAKEIVVAHPEVYPVDKFKSETEKDMFLNSTADRVKRWLEGIPYFPDNDTEPRFDSEHRLWVVYTCDEANKVFREPLLYDKTVAPDLSDKNEYAAYKRAFEDASKKCEMKSKAWAMAMNNNRKENKEYNFEVTVDQGSGGKFIGRDMIVGVIFKERTTNNPNNYVWVACRKVIPSADQSLKDAVTSASDDMRKNVIPGHLEAKILADYSTTPKEKLPELRAKLLNQYEIFERECTVDDPTERRISSNDKKRNVNALAVKRGNSILGYFKTEDEAKEFINGECKTRALKPDDHTIEKVIVDAARLHQFTIEPDEMVVVDPVNISEMYQDLFDMKKRKSIIVRYAIKGRKQFENAIDEFAPTGNMQPFTVPAAFDKFVRDTIKKLAIQVRPRTKTELEDITGSTGVGGDIAANNNVDAALDAFTQGISVGGSSDSPRSGEPATQPAQPAQAAKVMGDSLDRTQKSTGSILYGLLVETYRRLKCM